MKKIISIILAVVLSVTICACGSQKKSDNTNENSSISIEETGKELNDIFSSITATHTDCETLMSIIYNYWNYNGWESFFDYEEFRKADNRNNSKNNYAVGSFYGDAKLSFEYRDKITESLDKIQNDLKSLSITDETKAYYNAVKELYICVDSFYSFVSAYPTGYSKLTYTQAVGTHKDEYEKLVSAVEFEQ